MQGVSCSIYKVNRFKEGYLYNLPYYQERQRQGLVLQMQSKQCPIYLINFQHELTATTQIVYKPISTNISQYKVNSSNFNVIRSGFADSGKKNLERNEELINGSFKHWIYKSYQLCLNSCRVTHTGQVQYTCHVC